ncbi:MAG: LysR family transcriptional regulator [Neisseria sp.]|nr:LysR family transcriptional regulator [Neisseria sp.]
MNNISWRGIRAFLQVAESGSFTAAADATGLSKANISQLVSELERQLGVQLLYRTTRRLQLTEIGKGYHARCEQAIAALDAAAEWAMQSTNAVKGVIRVNSVGGVVGENLIAPLLLAFQRRYPEVEVRLDFSSIRVDLIDGHYDLVIRMGDLPDSTLMVQKLHNFTTHYVATPELLARYPAINHPDDLKNLPLICGSVDHWQFSKNGTKASINVEKGLRINSGKALRHAALAGMGVVRNSDIYVAADIARGDLTDILAGWSPPIAISMISPPLQHQLKRVSTLQAWLKQHFAHGYRQILQQGAEQSLWTAEFECFNE